MSAIRGLIDQIVKDSVHATLKPRGFRRGGRNFRKAVGSATQIVNLQASSWNSGDSGRFTLNLGVYFPEAAVIHGMDTEQSQPLTSACIVESRIGRLMPLRSDYWWEVDLTTDLAGLSREVASVIEDCALPWLDRSSTYAGALAYAAERQNSWWQAIFALLLDDRALAQAQLRAALDKLGQHELRDRLVRWGREHGLEA